jgi:Mor family transcriptional regulator
VLLDPGQCARHLLQHIYASLPTLPIVNHEQWNAEIYRRYLHGESVDTLAEAYGLSLSRIRWIIQHMARLA